MKGNYRFKIILAVMAGLICFLLFITGYLIGEAQGRKKVTTTAEASQDKELRSRVVNKKNIDEFSESIDERVKKRPGSYEVIMNTEWFFDDNGMESDNAYVENSKDNTNKVRFLLSLEDKPDDILYTSDVIPVGDRISGIQLDRPVPSGRNRAIVTYQLLDEEGYMLGEVKAGVTLVFGE